MGATCERVSSLSRRPSWARPVLSRAELLVGQHGDTYDDAAGAAQ